MIDNNKILVELESKLKSVTDIESFTKVKVEYLGKKGLITNLMQEMRNVEDKKIYGQMVNVLKEAIEEKIKVIEDEMNRIKMEEQLMKDAIDISLPSRKMEPGVQSILISTAREIEDVFYSFHIQPKSSQYHCLLGHTSLRPQSSLLESKCRIPCRRLQELHRGRYQANHQELFVLQPCPSVSLV